MATLGIAGKGANCIIYVGCQIVQCSITALFNSHICLFLDSELKRHSSPN